MMDSQTLPSEGTGSGRSALSVLLWGTFALFCLIFFTALKIPQAKIHSYITGYIASQLLPMGIEFTADQGRIALGLGVSYEMSGVKLTKLATNKTLNITEVRASPSLLGLLQGKLGATFTIDEGAAGTFEATVLTQGSEGEISFNADGLQVGRMGAIPFLIGVDGNAEIRGEGEFVGDFTKPHTLSGNAKLNLSRIVVDSQNISGFKLPRINVADGQIDVTLGGAKAAINQLRLGKAGGNDDLHLNVTGDLKLKPFLESSEANIRAKLGFSEAIKQSLAGLDVLLQKYRLPDGTYAFRVNGIISQTIPIPDTP